MWKKVVLSIFVLLAVGLTASFAYWTTQPTYTLSKIISAARAGDTSRIEKLMDFEGVANSIIEESLRISQEKFPVVGTIEDKNPKAKEFFKQMAQSFLRDILNSKTPGFKFKEMGFHTYFLLQTKLFLDSFTQQTITRSADIVDVAYDLKILFQQNYFAVFTYKKIGNEWTLFEVKDLTPR
jgi:hypothetical protein